MRDQRRLDLEGADPVAGREDDVVLAALEPEVAVLVLADVVAGRPPLALERLVAQVVAEEGGDGLRADLELALVHPDLDSRQRPAHRAVARRVVLVGPHPGHRAGLGLPVAVADRKLHLAPEVPNHLRVERLPGRDQAPQRADPAQLGPLGEHPVFGRRLAEDVDALALDQLEALGRVEAGVVDQRRRPPQPWSDEDVASRLRPAGGRGAPGEVALLGADPVLGLKALAGQVALRIDDPARFAGGPRGEDDHRGIVGIERGDVGGGLLGTVLVEDIGDLVQGHRRHPVGQLAEQPLLADAEPRSSGPGSQLQVLAAELRVAGQRHRPHPEAGEHRQHPLDPAADQGHHRVAALDPASRDRPREAGASGDQLAHVPVAALTVGAHRHHRQPRRRGALHHVLDEIHPPQSAGATRGIVCASD